MTDDQRLDSLLTDLVADGTPSHAPERLRHHILFMTSRTRPRSRWLALVTGRPMRQGERLVVGSPTVRLAVTLLLMSLLALMAVATVVGATGLMAGPATIIVARDGSGTVRTIREAVSMAADGDTILVRPGTYLESVEIARDVTIRGDGDRAAIILDPSTSIATTEVARFGRVSYGLLLTGTDAVISGLTIRGAREGTGVVVNGGAPTLDRLTILMGDPSVGATDGAVPVGFFGGSTGTVQDSDLNGYIPIRGGSPSFLRNAINGYMSIDGPGAPVVRGNRFSAGSAVGTSFGGSALIESNEFAQGWVSADTGSDPTIRGNVIHGNDLGAATCAAICIDQYAAGMSAAEVQGAGLTQADLEEISAVVQDNEVALAAVGIQVRGTSAAPIIRGNTIRDSGTGVSIGDGALGMVQDNTLTRNAIGVTVAADAMVSGNIVRESTDTGLAVTAGSPHLTGNLVEAGQTGIAVAGSATPALHDNVVCGNAVDIRAGDMVMDALNGITVCPAEAGPLSPAP